MVEWEISMQVYNKITNKLHDKIRDVESEIRSIENKGVYKEIGNKLLKFLDIIEWRLWELDKE